MDGGAFRSTFNYITAAAADRKVAVFHWRRHDLSTTKPINDRVRDLAEPAACTSSPRASGCRPETVIVGYPVILRELPDLLPEIELQELIVVVNQMASRLLGGGDPQYDPEVLRANARQRSAPRASGCRSPASCSG